MIKLILALVLALATSAASLAQPTAAGPDLWRLDGDRISFVSALIGFPQRAGPTRLGDAFEFSRQGQGLDNGLQYRSPDDQIFATAYLYYPGLPHAGISAFATENAILVQSGANLRVLRSGIVGAGGRENVAIRADYAGFRDSRMATSAAFIKVGRWIVKLRVSGPESRRADVERTMTELLDGMRFEGTIAPRTAEPLEVADCRDRPTQAAAPLTGNATDAAEEAVLGVLDGAGDEGREQGAAHRAGTPVVGTGWCLSSRVQIGNSNLSILRADAAAPDDQNRSVLIASITDSGTMIEVVRTRRRNGYVMFHHQIGRTMLLGAYAGVPTDQQINDIVSGADRAGGEARATITHKTDGNANITLHVAPPAGTAPTT